MHGIVGGEKHIEPYVANVNYRSMLDALANSLILEIDANDRNIVLFEGDTVLDKVIEIEVRNFLHP